MKTILPYLILLSAISVSCSAAFYSIYGLSKLFSGAANQVIIMASSLEISKIVIATLLHTYWNSISKLLKTYLTIALIVLVCITSAGIYGFLSSAYQDTANFDKIESRKIDLIDSKIKHFQEIKDNVNSESEIINESISELRISLGNPSMVQYIDKESGEKITTTSSSARKSLENQLTEANKQKEKLFGIVLSYTDSINRYEFQKLEMKSNSEVSSELGPLKYISAITNTPMDDVVNYFLLLIIFVFDPLAIALVLAANFAFNHRNNEKEDVIIPIPEVDKLDDVEIQTNIQDDIIESESDQDEFYDEKKS